MTKQEFLDQLRKGLSGLPKEDIKERLEFYSEIIEDQMEEGLSEEEAVFAVGPVEGIVAQIITEIPLTKIAKERIKPKKKLSITEITLLALGSPIWLSLGIAAFAILLSVYISLWALIVSLWSVFASFVGCFIGGMIACIIFALEGNVASGIFVLSAGLVCAGLSIFAFYGCQGATKAILILTKKIALWFKHLFMKKEDM